MKKIFLNLVTIVAILFAAVGYATPAYANEVTPKAPAVEKVKANNNGDNGDPNPNHDGDPDPCIALGNCGQGDNGHGDPGGQGQGSEHANCNAAQGEVDPECEEDPDPTETADPTGTATATQTVTATQTPPPPTATTAVPTVTTAVPTTEVPTLTSTATPSVTPSVTNTPVTATPTASPTGTPTGTATATNTPQTSTPTIVPTATTAVPTATTAVPTLPTTTATSTFVPTETATLVPTETIVPTTPAPTFTPPPVSTEVEDEEEENEGKKGIVAKSAMIPVTGACNMQDFIVINRLGELIMVDLAGNEISLTANFDPKINGPDTNVNICKAVVETIYGLYLIGADGSTYQLTNNGGDLNPQFFDNTTIYFDRDGMIYYTDVQGTSVSKVGSGTHTLFGANGMMALTDAKGNLLVENKLIANNAIGINWLPDGSGIIFYDTCQRVYDFASTSASTCLGGNDSAPDPHKAGYVGFVELGYNVGPTYANQGEYPEFKDAIQPDWSTTTPIKFNAAAVTNWIKSK